MSIYKKGDKPMGYRSDVVIALTKEIYLKEKILDDGTFPTLFNDEREVLIESIGAYIWVFEGYKWYAGYEDVDQMTAFLEKLEKEHELTGLIKPDGSKAAGARTGYPFGFLRVGEDSNDIEEHGQPWDFDIFPNTYISYPES